ncbi:hypothetical protein ACFV2Q_32030 [Streptomyces sp. NPDC059650]|uniref:hypothetical protein n=1 Tax=Streptomyces sp. NPDC059650 TaxID=3346896 RepID=UPI0036A09057
MVAVRSAATPREAAVRRLLVPLALAAAVLWCWAVLRLALAPDESGPLEGAAAVGGWGLGLLPVHCAPEPSRTSRAARGARLTTRASTPRRSVAGSDPS